MHSSKSVAYQSNASREGLKSTNQLEQEVQTVFFCLVGDHLIQSPLSTIHHLVLFENYSIDCPLVLSHSDKQRYNNSLTRLEGRLSYQWF